MSSYFSENFDNGIGALNHTWGNGIDTSVRGQVTIKGDSGIMENPWGDAAGHGYGTYSITASLSGHAAGPAGAAVARQRQVARAGKWTSPSSSAAAPTARCTSAADGSDVYGSVYYGGVDEFEGAHLHARLAAGQRHLLGRRAVYGGFSDNVGRDYDHGGINEVFWIMNRGGGTSITVYDISYSPSGGGAVGGSAVQAEVTTAAARSAPRPRSTPVPWRGQRRHRLQPVRRPARLDVAGRGALLGLPLIRTGLTSTPASRSMRAALPQPGRVGGNIVPSTVERGDACPRPARSYNRAAAWERPGCAA